MDSKLDLFNKTSYLLEQYRDLFAPLSQLGIKDFSYYKVTEDGRAIYISSNEQWHKKHYINAGGMDGIERSIRAVVPHKIRNVIFSGDVNNPHDTTKKLFAPNQNMNAQTMFDNNMWNSSCFYIPHDNYFESFNFFGGNDKAHLVDLFDKNSHYLKQYISYFLVQARPIFEAIERNEMLDLGFNLRDVKEDQVNFIQCILKAADNTKIVISDKQSELLSFLSQGKPMKQVGHYLDITPSTANNYLMRLKAKLGFSDTKELISAWQYSLQSTSPIINSTI